MIHVVAEGETLYSIAERYQVSEERVRYDNQIEDPVDLVPGQALLILIPEIVHVVQAGESLYGIAEDYGTTVLALLRNNPYLDTRAYLIPGEAIVISYEEKGTRDAVVGGYAYPYIREDILREALLYLSELMIFSYGFNTLGDLIAPDDEWLIQEALNYGVAPIMVLTPIYEGRFNNYLVNQVVENPSVAENLIDQILQTVEAKGYAGVDVDFEYILPEDREGYAAFIRDLTERMNAQGYRVSVALAPKTSAEQRGVLYEGMDYRLLGEYANWVFLMTYEWGYTYGPPMAVAPIPSVRRILDYAVTEIPPEKISMGIPNYGYDWPLPFERGTTRAASIGNPEAVALAAANGVEIQFDSEAQAPYFYYVDSGVTHVVWFEDMRSISAKFSLVEEYNFRGMGYWNLMRPFRANWLVLHSRFSIRRE